MTDKTENGGPMHVDTDLVRQLAELLDATNLTEIEVEDGDRKIRVARKISSAAAPVYAPAPVAAPVAPAAPAEAAPAPGPDLSNAVK